MQTRARTVTVLAVFAVLVALAASAGVPVALAAQARCTPVETTPDEGHQHLLGEAMPPVGYRSTPPASGWHYRQRDRVRLGVAAESEPLSEPEQVSVLAVGGVVISYRDLPAGDREALASLVSASGERPLALTSYEALEPGEVALSAWRRVQRCDGVDLAAVETFVDAYAAAEPDFAMTGEATAHDHDEEVLPPPAAGVGSASPWPPWALGAVGLALLAGFALAARRALRSPALPASEGGHDPPDGGWPAWRARWHDRRRSGRSENVDDRKEDRAGSLGIDQP